MATWLERSFLLRLVHFFNLLRIFVLSETRCSRNKTSNLNNNIFLTKSSDTFCSPDYDTSEAYPGNLTCTWVISLQEKRIKLSFLTFDLQNASPACQDCDFVSVRDGKYSNSPVIGTFCGSRIPNDVLSTGNHMWIHFRSDGSVEKRGFKMSYTTYDTSNAWPDVNVSFFIFAPGLSAVSFLVASAVVVFILILVGVVASAIKRRNSLSSTRVKVYKTRPGITIKVSPATPIENRSKASLHNDTVTDSNLVLPK
ncbi:unnamed protein product, partial [Pocillopora meandrina]